MRRQKRSRLPELPAALTIAGSDSGGGAGIQADLKTFAALRVHGLSAITCVTAQNPLHVARVEPVGSAMVREQLEAVFEAFQPGAAKIGMLYSAAIIRSVTEFFRNHRRLPIILDPVMISTSGGRLLEKSAVKLLRAQLLPLASLVTPNIDEAELLTETKVRTPEQMRSAARRVHEISGGAVLIKGGHLIGRSAIDVYYDGRTELLLSAPFLRGINTHGTGCTYSAAIAAYIAHGKAMEPAVRNAKEYITQSIARSKSVGAFQVLG